jgi:glycosyltransferase involved in cell wall biosynthesis
MAQTLCFVEGQLPRLAEFESIAPPTQLTVVLNDDLDTIQALARRIPFPVVRLRSVVDFSEVNRLISYVIHHWYMVEGQDISRVNSYSLGHLLALPLIYMGTDQAWLWLATQRLLEREQPDRVVFYGYPGDWAHVLSSLTQQLGLPFSLLWRRDAQALRRKAKSVLRLVLLPLYRYASEWASIMVGRWQNWQLDRREEPSRSKRDRILVFTSHPNHVNAAFLLIDVLQTQGKYDVRLITVGAKTGWGHHVSYGFENRSAVEKRGISYRYFWGYGQARMLLQPHLGRCVWQQWGTAPTLHENLVWQGLNIFAAFQSSLEAYLRYLFSGRNLLISKRMLTQEQPALAIVPVTVGWAPIVPVVARELHIPTLAVQHGVFASDDPMYEVLYADRLAVWGQAVKELVVSQGILPERVVCTGAPILDDLSRRQFRPMVLRQELGVPPTDRLITLASEPGGSRHLYANEVHHMVMEILKAIQQLPTNFHLVIKLRPGEDGVFHRNAVASLDLSDRVTVVQSVDLHELLHASELVIVFASTVGLEAIALGRPLLVVNFTGRPDLVDYVDRGTALGVYREADLLPAIRRVLDDPAVQQRLAAARRQFVQDYLYRLDGLSSQRVVALVDRMIDEWRRRR